MTKREREREKIEQELHADLKDNFFNCGVDEL